MTTPAELAAELTAERDAFFAELARIEPGSLTTPGLAGDWSAREVIAHLGYWVGHAVERIHAAELGEMPEAEPRSVDEINATVARIARTAPLETVRAREAASVEAMLERLARIDPTVLDMRLPDGGPLLEVVREDGPDHYREHAEDLRRTLAETPRG